MSETELHRLGIICVQAANLLLDSNDPKVMAALTLVDSAITSIEAHVSRTVIDDLNGLRRI